MDETIQCSIGLTVDEVNALVYVKVFMQELHCERQLPPDLVKVASTGMNALDKILAAIEEAP